MYTSHMSEHPYLNSSKEIRNQTENKNILYFALNFSNFSNDYKGGFGTALMTKDLGLAQDAATRTQAATPLGSLAHQVISQFLHFS